jgi:hypothetical protein
MSINYEKFHFKRQFYCKKRDFTLYLKPTKKDVYISTLNLLDKLENQTVSTPSLSQFAGLAGKLFNFYLSPLGVGVKSRNLMRF